MPRVLNKKTDGEPAGSVYIGRPSKWGNPYSHVPIHSRTFATLRTNTREEAIALYEAYLNTMLRAEGGGTNVFTDEIVSRDILRAELRGRDLVCWCKPLACHGDILLRLANE